MTRPRTSRLALLLSAPLLALTGLVGAPTASAEHAEVPDYQPILDSSASSFADWAYAGNGGFARNADGTVTSRVGAGGGFGTLWYVPEQFGDFELRVQFRDDAPGEARANSGLQVRFPPLVAPVPGCPTTFNGGEQNNLSWIAVNCGHEIQLNDSPEGGTNDPRKSGSIYGFADLDLAAARPTPKGVWNELVVRVVGQHYTVLRDDVVINEFENLPGLPFPGRPNDPDSSSRGLTGHVGLQAHGSAPDVMTFRAVDVRDLTGVSRTDAWLNSLEELLDELVEQGRINPRVAASLDDRLQRAGDLADTGSRTRTAGLLRQFVARAENQVRGDADDLQVRAALVSQAEALLEVLQD